MGWDSSDKGNLSRFCCSNSFYRIFSVLLLLDKKNFWGFVVFSLFSVVVTCVPLFFLCTGFLSHNTSLKKAISTVFSVSTLYIFYLTIFLVAETLLANRSYLPADILSALISGNDILDREWYLYAFYIMTIFTPFLNMGWLALTKEYQRALILLMVAFCTVLQAIYDLFHISVFPFSYFAYNIIIFPFMYFFIGKYVAENGVSIKKRYIAGLLFVVIITKGWILTRLYGSTDIGLTLIQYAKASIFLPSLLIFLLLYDIRLNKRLLRIVKWISRTSLDTYLGALVFEAFLYRFDVNGYGDFIRKNICIMFGILFLAVIAGNLRILISQKIMSHHSLKLKSSEPVFRLSLTVMFSVILIASIAYLNARPITIWSADRIGSNVCLLNASIEENYIKTQENASGVLTYGPYINLYPGRWRLTVDYEADSDGFQMDGVTASGANVDFCCVLSQEKTCFTREIVVQNQNDIWEFRTIGAGQGTLKIYRMELKKIK